WAISKHFGWASDNSAQQHFDALARKGYLERNEIGNWRLAGEARLKIEIDRKEAGSILTLWQRSDISGVLPPSLIIRCLVATGDAVNQPERSDDGEPVLVLESRHA